jgi:hypothetical protein
MHADEFKKDLVRIKTGKVQKFREGLKKLVKNDES